MTWVVMFLVLLAGALLQTWAPGPAWLGGAKCPFLMSAVLYYAFTRSPAVMLVAAAAAGVLQDGLSPIPFGYSSFCFSVVGLLAAAFRQLVLSESLTTQILFGAAAAAAATMGMHLLLSGAGLTPPAFGWTLLKVLGAALLGGVATPAVFRGTGALDRLVGNAGGEGEPEERAHGFRWPA